MTEYHRDAIVTNREVIAATRRRWTPNGVAMVKVTPQF
jgi:hypothetical protein